MIYDISVVYLKDDKQIGISDQIEADNAYDALVLFDELHSIDGDLIECNLHLLEKEN